MNIRTDVPMAGLEDVMRDLETLDRMITDGKEHPSTFRTMVLGILARLNVAISEIHES